MSLKNHLTAVAFTGLVTAVAVWSIWGTDMFPTQPDPTGGMLHLCPIFKVLNDSGPRSRNMDSRGDEEMAFSSK